MIKFTISLALLVASSLLVRADKLALVGGTVINPATSEVLPNTNVVIDGETIARVGTTAALSGAKTIDCAGKFILPGYIDTHVHFFQSGGLFTRPDAVDLTSIRSYKDEIAWIDRHLRDTFARYIRCGITSVLDVGGPMTNFRLRKLAQDAGTAPRIAVAGPLISSVARPQLELTPEETAWGNPEVIASLDVTKLPAEKMPERIKTAMEKPEPVLDRIRQIYDIALKNLKTLQDAGVIIATGTDAGNIGTIHGPSIFREFRLMKGAGLTPMQILQWTTANAARTFGGTLGPKLGAIAPGKMADLVVLESNPLDDIANTSRIESVIRNGVLHPAEPIKL